MARPQFDQADNEQWSTFIAKINQALDDLYGSEAGEPSIVSGVVTSSSLTTAGGSTASISITNAAITATSKVMVSVANGTNSAGYPMVMMVTPGAGSAVVTLANMNPSIALNGTLKLSYIVSA